MIDTLNFAKLNGLLPAVVQDSDSGAVLMLGFMNREALEKTIAGKQVVFYSRTKARLWKKGETSGNVLNVVSIAPDCDNDSLLIKAKPAGPVCHTGDTSCFKDAGGSGELSFISELIAIIKERRKEMPEESYTAKLFTRGIAKIGQKVGEEGVELAIAAQYDDKQRCIEEAADLLFHTFVLLEAKGIEFSSVVGELKGRMGKRRADKK